MSIRVALPLGACVVLLSSLAVASGVETYTWINGTNATIQRFEAQGLVFDGELYVFGGFIPGVDAITQSDAYDPVTNTWRSLAPMPEAITHAGQALDGSFIYLAGGFVGDHPGGSTNHVWIYDALLDSWQAGPNLPADRGGGGLVRVGRTLYYFAGATRPQGINVLTDFGDHWTLDLGPTADPSDDATSWQVAQDIPNPRNHMAGISLGGLVYGIGGQLGGDEVNGNQADVHVFDPGTGLWSSVADLPVPLGHVTASTFIVNGRILVAGGVTEGAAEADTVYQYDPVADEWSSLPNLPGVRQSPVSGYVDDIIVVTGGENGGIHVTTWETDGLTLIPDAIPGLQEPALLVLAALLLVAMATALRVRARTR